jgi:hypothetical protein
MKNVCRALIAVVAIGFAAPSVRADLYLSVTQIGVGTTYYDLSNGMATNSGTSEAAFQGWTLSATGTMPAGPGSQSVVLSATLKSLVSPTSAPGSFQFNLSSSTYSNHASSVDHLVESATYAAVFAAPSPATNSTGVFSNPSSGKGYLSSSLVVGKLPDLTDSTILFASNQAQYTGYGPPQTVTDLGEHLSGMGTANSTPVLISSLSPKFDLSDLTTDIQATSGSQVSFVSTATVALPEPSGVAAAFAGLPCMGMLLGFARRFRSRVASAAAVV